ncbi:MAG: hypothetical protein AAF215_09540 [Cyanobacteria bacterium P01_A01_bin.123]
MSSEQFSDATPNASPPEPLQPASSLTSNDDTENLDTAKVEFAAGLDAFERGNYRQSIQHLEEAMALSNRISRFGGEVQTWLVNAYAAGDRAQDAVTLCEKLSRHPDIETRKQGKRLLYILKAPKLKSRPEWLTQIPDLDAIHENGKDLTPRSRPANLPRPNRRKAPDPDLTPIDWSQINTGDNAFLWLALGAAVIILGGLWWFS